MALRVCHEPCCECIGEPELKKPVAPVVSSEPVVTPTPIAPPPPPAAVYNPMARRASPVNMGTVNINSSLVFFFGGIGG